MSTNCTGERSFSGLKRIKNEQRATLGQEKLKSLAILFIEHTLLQTIDFEDLIEEFARQKARKKSIQK